MKTSNTCKALSVILTFVGISLLLAGCFSNQNELKDKTMDALKTWNDQDQTRYSTTGKIEMDYKNADITESVLKTSSWKWIGNVDHQAPMHIFELTTGTSNSDNLSLVYQDEHWLTPWQEHEQEEDEVWFQFENNSSALGILNQPDPMSLALARWIEQIDPDILQEANDNEITAEIHAETASLFLSEWKESINGVGEPFATLHDTLASSENESNGSDSGTVAFEFGENNQLIGYHVTFDSNEVQVEWQQQRSAYLEDENSEFTAAVLPDDAIIIPFDTMLEKVDEIQTLHEIPSEIEFDQKIALKNDYTYPDGSEAAKVESLLNNHMQAMIDGDLEAHEKLFRRPSFAERHQELIETERKFQFTHIEDLNFKNFNDTVRVGVVYDFVDPGDVTITSSALWYTMNKNDKGEWKIDSIK